MSPLWIGFLSGVVFILVVQTLGMIAIHLIMAAGRKGLPAVKNPFPPFQEHEGW